MNQPEDIFRRWLDRTVSVLSREIDRLDVKDTGDLKAGLTARLSRLAEERFLGEIRQ